LHPKAQGIRAFAKSDDEMLWVTNMGKAGMKRTPREELTQRDHRAVPQISGYL
jgi:hypothetical protein